MKAMFVVAAALIFAMVVFGQQPAPPQAHDASDLQAIQELEKEDAMAAKTNDVDRLTSLWTDDAVLLQPMSPPIVGRSSIRALLQAQKQHSANVVMAFLHRRLEGTEDQWRESLRVGKQSRRRCSFRMANRLHRRSMRPACSFGREGNSWRFARAIISPAPPPAEKNASGQKQ